MAKYNESIKIDIGCEETFTIIEKAFTEWQWQIIEKSSNYILAKTKKSFDVMFAVKIRITYVEPDELIIESKTTQVFDYGKCKEEVQLIISLFASSQQVSESPQAIQEVNEVEMVGPFDFKNATKGNLQKKYNQIAKELGDDQFFTKKELHYLPEILQNNEQVLAFTSGLMDGNTWLITLTDRRIIFLDKGMIYGLEQSVISLDKINAISGKTGIMFGEIIITDGAKDRKITNVWKKTVKKFTNKCNGPAILSKFTLKL